MQPDSSPWPEHNPEPENLAAGFLPSVVRVDASCIIDKVCLSQLQRVFAVIAPVQALSGSQAQG